MILKCIIFVIRKYFIDATDKFGRWDVYHRSRFQGTILAFGKNHAIDKIGKYDAYLRDENFNPIGINPEWNAEFSYAPLIRYVKRSMLSTKRHNHMFLRKHRNDAKRQLSK